MFQVRENRSKFTTSINLLELIYHATVRQLRQSHYSAVVGLIQNILKAMLMVAMFYIMFSLLGLRSMAIRGDFLLYVMSGIFLFMTHNNALGAVAGAEGAASAMMQHAPMNTVVSITAAALSALYTQIISMLIILLLYHSIVTPFVIIDPIGALGMVLIAWFSGVAVGMIFLAARPWAPGFVGVVKQFYMRANMIASGKMFLANSLPPAMLAMFDWNPLFHAIDQTRGFVFINYNPHNSSIEYPIYLSLALIMVGLMAEFFTRQHESASWGARR